MTRHGQVQGYHRQLLAERRNKNLYAHPPGLKPPTPEGRAATINRTPPFGDFEISIGRNEAGANLHTLVEEKKTLPRFQQKQEEIEALRKQAEELEREAFRLRQLAGEKSGELSDAIRDELEGEHGPIYPFIETWITTIHDPALKAQLEQLEESDGEQALAILKESWSSGKIEKLCYGQWGDMWFGNYKKWAREEVTTAIPLPPWTEPPTVEESKAAIEELWPVVQTQLKAAELPAD